MLDAFQIQDITTEGFSLEDLGRPEAARAKQEADIAEAVARRAAEQARLKAEEGAPDRRADRTSRGGAAWTARTPAFSLPWCRRSPGAGTSARAVDPPQEGTLRCDILSR